MLARAYSPVPGLPPPPLAEDLLPDAPLVSHPSLFPSGLSTGVLAGTALTSTSSAPLAGSAALEPVPGWSPRQAAQQPAGSGTAAASENIALADAMGSSGGARRSACAAPEQQPAEPPLTNEQVSPDAPLLGSSGEAPPPAATLPAEGSHATGAVTAQSAAAADALSPRSLSLSQGGSRDLQRPAAGSLTLSSSPSTAGSTLGAYAPSPSVFSISNEHI